jgi:hypothetical protein
MPEMIVYVKGPVQEKIGLFRRKRDVYLVNPQLYKDDNPNPIANLGVDRYVFDAGSAPSREEFSDIVEKKTIAMLGSGVPVGSIIIPPHTISVRIEYEKTEN